MKRVFHRLLCWVLVLAIAGIPALAAAVGMGEGHAGHTMHGAPSNSDMDQPAEHGAGHPEHKAAHHQHVHGGGPGHAGSPSGSDPAHAPLSEPTQTSELLVHAECADGACVAGCSACSHCQGMPAVTGIDLPSPDPQAMTLHIFRSGPPAAALFRPPILS